MAGKGPSKGHQNNHQNNHQGASIIGNEYRPIKGYCIMGQPSKQPAKGQQTTTNKKYKKYNKYK